MYRKLIKFFVNWYARKFGYRNTDITKSHWKDKGQEVLTFLTAFQFPSSFVFSQVIIPHSNQFWGTMWVTRTSWIIFFVRAIDWTDRRHGVAVRGRWQGRGQDNLQHVSTHLIRGSHNELNETCTQARAEVIEHNIECCLQTFSNVWQDEKDKSTAVPPRDWYNNTPIPKL